MREIAYGDSCECASSHVLEQREVGWKRLVATDCQRTIAQACGIRTSLSNWRATHSYSSSMSAVGWAMLATATDAWPKGFESTAARVMAERFEERREAKA